MNAFRIAACLLTLVFAMVLHAEDAKDKKTGPMVDGLKALKDPNARVRYKAIQTLIDLGPALAKFAVPDLREMLDDPNGQVRVKAAEALWKIDKTPSVTLMPVLLGALKDKEGFVRAAAPPVIALFGPKAQPALKPLQEALNDKELRVKISVITALGDLGPTAKDSALPLLDLAKDKEFRDLEPFVGAALTNLGDGIIPTLITALGDSSSNRRRVAIYALGAMGSKASPATDALAKALAIDDPATRQQAAHALGKIGPAAKSALPSLEKSLKDKVPAVRIEAALATWHISGDPKHVGVLIAALDHESIEVRDNACQSLAVMKSGAKAAVERVTKLLDGEELRLRAILTLGEIGPPAKPIVPKLQPFLQDKDSKIQMRTAFAIWQITGETKASLDVFKEMLGGPDEQYQQAIIMVGDIGAAAKDLMPTLVALYRDEEVAYFRRLLGDTIKKVDPPTAKKLGIK